MLGQDLLSEELGLQALPNDRQKSLYTSVVYNPWEVPGLYCAKHWWSVWSSSSRDCARQCFRSTVSRVHSFEFSWIYFTGQPFSGPFHFKVLGKDNWLGLPCCNTTYSIYFYFYDLLILSLQNNNTEGLTLRKRTFKITILKKRSSTRQKRITKGLNSLVTPTYIFCGPPHSTRNQTSSLYTYETLQRNPCGERSVPHSDL